MESFIVMKSLISNWCRESSIFSVLKPLMTFYNIFGISVLYISSKSLQLSFIAIVALIINLLMGIYILNFYISYGIVDVKNFQIVGFGITMVTITGFSNCLLTILSNSMMTNQLKKMFLTFINFDSKATKFLNLHHGLQFLVIFIFVTARTCYFISRILVAGSIFSMILVSHITISFFIANEFPVILMFMAAFRLTVISRFLEVSCKSRQRRQGFHKEDELKTCFILSQRIFEIVDLISKTFGFQMMIFWSTTLLIGMFTIFYLFNVVFVKSQTDLSPFLKSNIHFAVYDHVVMILICFINGKIDTEVNVLVVTLN